MVSTCSWAVFPSRTNQILCSLPTCPRSWIRFHHFIINALDGGLLYVWSGQSIWRTSSPYLSYWFYEVLFIPLISFPSYPSPDPPYYPQHFFMRENEEKRGGRTFDITGRAWLICIFSSQDVILVMRSNCTKQLLGIVFLPFCMWLDSFWFFLF